MREHYKLHLEYLASIHRVLIIGSFLDEIFRSEPGATSVPSVHIIVGGGDELLRNLKSVSTLFDQVCIVENTQLEFRTAASSENESDAWKLLSYVFDLVLKKTFGRLKIEGGWDWVRLGRPSQAILSVDEDFRESKFVERKTTNLRLQMDDTTRLPAQQTFKRLSLESAVPFYAPFIARTLATLSSAHIKSLSLHNSLGLLYFDYEYILPLLTLPALVDVFFGDIPIPFPSLQAFLARHKTIENLNLSGGRAIGYLPPLSSQRILPALRSLIADPEYLNHFLEPPDTFPSLTTVTIVSYPRLTLNTVAYDYSEFEPVLKLVARRPGEICLGLRIESSTGFTPWLQDLKIEEVGVVCNVVELNGYFSSPFDEGWDDVYDFAPLLALFPSLRRMSFV
ncbi:hypothetical protein H0H87_003932 [Tephrocybe sp. NHM501043]|nr:hypothetical protein H0H87_003932 [Tephrocybe sp. NHM501043]